jgi:hypothetical protein
MRSTELLAHAEKNKPAKKSNPLGVINFLKVNLDDEDQSPGESTYENKFGVMIQGSIYSAFDALPRIPAL